MVSELKGYARFISEQSPYNLLDRRIENELIPMCQAYGVGILAWSPLAMGILAGRYLDWDVQIDTNLSGVFYLSRAAVPHLKKSPAAWILNIGSLAGRNTFAGGVAYNASKFGLLGMTEAMMLDLRYDGIRVSHIMPGSVDTGFGDRPAGQKEGWALTPEDVSRAVLDLLRYPGNALPSRVELRPSQPPRKS